MTVLQALAAVTLWRSRAWDTLDIARALSGGREAVSEADVVKVIDIARAAEKPVALAVVPPLRSGGGGPPKAVEGASGACGEAGRDSAPLGLSASFGPPRFAGGETPS